MYIINLYMHFVRYFMPKHKIATCIRYKLFCNYVYKSVISVSFMYKNYFFLPKLSVFLPTMWTIKKRHKAKINLKYCTRQLISKIFKCEYLEKKLVSIKYYFGNVLRYNYNAMVEIQQNHLRCSHHKDEPSQEIVILSTGKSWVPIP